MDQAKLDKVQSWMASKGVNSACPACGKNNWEAAAVIAAPTFSEGGAFAIGGPTVPMLPLICTNCGYIRFFAAVMLGIAK